MSGILNRYFLAAAIGTSACTSTIAEEKTDFDKLSPHVVKISSSVNNRITQLISKEPGFYGNFVEYIIQPGDNLGYISQTFGISEDKIIASRKLFEKEPNAKDGWEFLKVGRKLMIPISDEAYYNVKEIIDKAGIISEQDKNEELYNSQTKENLKKLENRVVLGNRVYPKTLQYLGGSKILKTFDGNSQMGVGDFNAPCVDEDTMYETNCAETMKCIFKSTIPEKYWTDTQKKFFITKGIHAWVLHDWLLKMDFKQTHNLMPFFNLSKAHLKVLGGKGVDILDLDKEEEYNKKLIEAYHFIETVVDSRDVLIPMMYSYSFSKNTVIKFNKKRKDGDKVFNTHQVMGISNGKKELIASSIGKYNYAHKSEESVDYDSDRDVVTFIIDYVQQGLDYNGALSKVWEKKLLKDLPNFETLINIEVDGEKVNLGDELKLESSERIQVHPHSKVIIKGIKVADGFHRDSNLLDVSLKNHSRVRFLFEYILDDSYRISEVLVGPERKDPQRLTYGEELLKDVDVPNHYTVKFGEKVELAVKEAIIRYKLKREDLLIPSKDEIKLMDKIEYSKWLLRPPKPKERIPKEWREERAKLTAEDRVRIKAEIVKIRPELIEMKTVRINDIIDQLYFNDKMTYLKEYEAQFQFLMMYGVMSNPNSINDGGANINAIIPLADIHNIKKLHKKYIEDRKKELFELDKIADIDNNSNFVNINIFPGDTNILVYNQIQTRAMNYTEKYPIFNIMGELNLLQKYQVFHELDVFIAKDGINLTDGKLNKGENFILGLKKLSEILLKVKDKTFLDKPELGDNDTKINKEIIYTAGFYNAAGHILTKESYVPDPHIYKRRFAKQFLRDWDTLFPDYPLRRVTSFGDYQTKFLNLFGEEQALTRWPTKDHILNAIIATKNNLESQRLEEIVSLKHTMFYETYKNDIENLDKLVLAIKYVQNHDRVPSGNEAYVILKELFRFDPGTKSNIVGYILQTHLLKDKIDEHIVNVVGWIQNSGFSMGEIIQSDALYEMVERMSIRVNNLSEDKALRMVLANFFIRNLEAFGLDAKSDIFPVLNVKASGNINYTNTVIMQHFQQYLDIAGSLDDDKNGVKNELVKILGGIVKKGKITNEEIFEIARNPILREFLKENNKSIYILPTKEELNNSDFRKVGFGYALASKGRFPVAPNSQTGLYVSSFIAGMGTLGALVYGIFFRRINRFSGKVTRKMVNKIPGVNLKKKNEVE